jgi:hypothetical protein
MIIRTRLGLLSSGQAPRRSQAGLAVEVFIRFDDSSLASRAQ